MDPYHTITNASLMSAGLEGYRIMSGGKELLIPSAEVLGWSKAGSVKAGSHDLSDRLDIQITKTWAERAGLR